MLNKTLSSVRKLAQLPLTAGGDSANPGTTCIKLSLPVLDQCTNGYIGIPKNNSDLVRAALVAKSSKSKVWAYYDISSEALPNHSGHCPGIAFTKCSLISLMLND